MTTESPKLFFIPAGQDESVCLDEVSNLKIEFFDNPIDQPIESPIKLIESVTIKHKVKRTMENSGMLYFIEPEGSA